MFEHPLEERHLFTLIQTKSLLTLKQALAACVRFRRQRTVKLATMDYKSVQMTIYPFFDAFGELQWYVLGGAFL